MDDDAPVPSRRYHSPLRAERAAATRQRIMEAARELFDDPACECTLEQVAARAGVTVQTVLRAFGSRNQLIVAVIGTGRDAETGDAPQAFPTAATAVTALFDDYEVIGDRVVRMLAMEHRDPALADVAAHGRAMHARWVETALHHRLRHLRGRRRELVRHALVAATDVYVWKVLRRDLGLDRRTAEAVVVRLVDGASTGSAGHDTSEELRP